MRPDRPHGPRDLQLEFYGTLGYVWRRFEAELTANGDEHGDDRAIERMDVGGGLPGGRGGRPGGRVQLCVVGRRGDHRDEFSRAIGVLGRHVREHPERDPFRRRLVDQRPEPRAGEAEPFAKYRVTVPTDGTYQLYTRKFWKHGPFRWRFGEGEWQTCGRDVALLDSTPIRQFLEANWVRLGDVKLNAGEQTFELRLLAKEGEGKVAAFDAFVLMQSPFVPRGKLKPDSKSGQAADGFWAFEPDADTFEHTDLDLRSLNEAQAGISGHVRREGGHFVLGDGRPVRFWAVQAGTMELDRASVDFLARRLAKAGVNLVRMEANIRDGSSADPMAVSREKLDRLHYVIAALKREGIYTYLGHNFWGTAFTTKDSYGIPGFHDGDKGAALLIFSPRMQEIYKAWAKAQAHHGESVYGRAAGEGVCAGGVRGPERGQLLLVVIRLEPERPGETGVTGSGVWHVAR